MKRSIPEYTLAVVVLVLIVGCASFICTKSSWYDHLKLEQQVLFWSEAAVGFGTLALAVVTWGSVRESQNIIANEDLRFKQARMPMVFVCKTYRDTGGVFIALRNNGDGPALNVRVSFDANTILRWNNMGSTANHNQVEERDVAIENELCSSFMPVGEAGVCEWTFGAKEQDIPAVNAEASVKFRGLQIEYEDVFGFQYATVHYSNIGGDTIPFRFAWHPPRELLGNSLRLGFFTVNSEPTLRL